MTGCKHATRDACEKACRPKARQRDGWKCVERTYDCLGLMRWRQCEPCKIPDDPDCKYGDKPACEATCRNAGGEELPASCGSAINATPTSVGESNPLAGPSALGAGVASGSFGFIPSGGLSATCACESGFGWQKQGDHPCGCSGASLSVSATSTANGPGGCAQPMASAAATGQCSEKCCCEAQQLCIEGKGATRRTLGPLTIGLGYRFNAEVLWRVMGGRDGEVSKCSLEWWEMFIINL